MGEEDLGSAVTRLSQAALGVADLWTTFRGYSAASVSDDVEEFLVARRIGFDRREKLVGRSQRVYTVDFHTRTPQRSALVNVLSTGSRATADCPRLERSGVPGRRTTGPRPPGAATLRPGSLQSGARY